MVRPSKVGHRLTCPGSDLRNYKQSFKVKVWAFFHVIPKPLSIHK